MDTWYTFKTNNAAIVRDQFREAWTKRLLRSPYVALFAADENQHFFVVPDEAGQMLEEFARSVRATTWDGAFDDERGPTLLVGNEAVGWKLWKNRECAIGNGDSCEMCSG